MSEIPEYTSPLDDLVEPTDFTFELPDATQARIVVVDNDRTSGTLNAGILQSGGYNVALFTSADEALESIHQGDATVLVTDF